MNEEGSMPAKPMIEKVVARFNERARKDPELSNELAGFKKKVLIDLGTEKFNFTLMDKCIDCVNEGSIPDPDITLITDPDTLEKLINGEMKAMKAWALKKVRLKGSLDDVLRFRKFL